MSNSVEEFIEAFDYSVYGKCQIFFDFSLTVKAVPHECVIRTGLP